MIENWCYEKEALELFAKHYETGEIIPIELVQKIKESATFQEGITTLRQLSFGLLNMSWYGANTTGITDIKEAGYSSGNNSCKWAEVLDTEAFDNFKEKGIFNKEVATKFKDHILSKGGTENPMVLYKRFIGTEPKVEALLEPAGLI